MLETVVEGETGVLWEGGPAELAAAVREFDTGAVDPQACVENANRFSAEKFRTEFPREVARAVAESPAERAELGLVRPRAVVGPRLRGPHRR